MSGRRRNVGKTTIEWTDFSINPLRARNIETGAVGHWCEKISTGCKNCFASRLQSPYLTQIEYRAENRPKVELFFDDNAIGQVIRRKKSTRFFWCDMSDMFLADYPDEWIDRCFAAMALTPQHTHMVLTKRAERMREYCAKWRGHFVCEYKPGYSTSRIWPLDNVWLGVSVEGDSQHQRIWDLLKTPAALRFISYEPALEPLDLDKWEAICKTWRRGATIGRYLDWVIVGGESGPSARPFDIAWARQVVRQCRAAGVPPFVKQLGAQPEEEVTAPLDGHKWMRRVVLRDRKGGDMDEWPADLRVRELPEALTGK
jgi:protein gp37